MADTRITFSSVEQAVDEIKNGRKNMEGNLDDFATIIRNLIANGDLVGTAAETFEQTFEDLKKQRFDSYINLVEDFANIIAKASQSTQDTAAALDNDATQILYH